MALGRKTGGRKKGTPNKAPQSDKEWNEAIRLAVHEQRDDPDNPGKVKALRLLARKVVDKALDGDMTAAKEIGDRLDGRPTQTIAGDPKQPHKLVIEIIDPTR